MLCTIYAYFYLSIFNRNHILVIELRMTTFLIKKFDDDDDDDDDDGDTNTRKCSSSVSVPTEQW